MMISQTLKRYPALAALFKEQKTVLSVPELQAIRDELEKLIDEYNETIEYYNP